MPRAFALLGVALLAACSSSPTAPSSANPCAADEAAAVAIYGANNYTVQGMGPTEVEYEWVITYPSGPPKDIDVLFNWSSGACVESPAN